MANGVLGLLRLAKVAVNEISQVVEVLEGARLVQSIVVSKCRDRLRVSLRQWAQVRTDRVAGNELRQDECDQRDPDRKCDKSDEPAAERGWTEMLALFDSPDPIGGSASLVFFVVAASYFLSVRATLLYTLPAKLTGL